MILSAIVSLDSMRVREVGSVKWGTDIGIGSTVWPIYLHLYEDSRGHRYAISNILGGGVVAINIEDPTSPYVERVIRADTLVFRFPAHVSGAGVTDAEIIGRWLIMSLDDGGKGGIEVWDIGDMSAPVRVGTVEFDSIVIPIKGRVHTLHIDRVRMRMFINLYYRPMYVLKIDTGKFAMGDVLGALEVKDMIGIETGSYHHDIYVVHGVLADTVYSFQGSGGNTVCSPGEKGLTRWIVINNLTDSIVADGYVARCSGYGFSHSGRIYRDSILFNFYESEGSGYAIYRLDKTTMSVKETLVYYRATGFGEKSSVHEGEIANGRLYVAYYWGGLRIYDIGNLREPIPVGYYDFYDEEGREHILNGASDVKVRDGYVYVVGFMGYDDPYGRDSGYFYVFRFDSTYTIGEEYVKVKACRYPIRPYLRVMGVEHRVDADTSLISRVKLPIGTYRVEIRQTYGEMDAPIDTFTLVVDGTPDTTEAGGRCEGAEYSGGKRVRFVGKNTAVVIRDNGKVIYLEGENNRWIGAVYFGEGRYPAIAGDRDVCMDADIVWVKHDTVKYAAKPFGIPAAITFDSLPIGGTYSNLRYLNAVRVWDSTNTYRLHLFFVANDGGGDVIVHNTYVPYNICPIVSLPALLSSEVLWEVNESDGLSVAAYSSGSEKIHLVWESGDTLYYANWDGSVWTFPYPFLVAPSGVSIKQPTVKVEGGDVYVGWVEEVGMAKVLSMRGRGIKRDTLGTWRDTIDLYTARRITRVHYAGNNYYMFGYEDGFITSVSDILAENMNSRFVINLTGDAVVRDEWPYGKASLRYPSSGVKFRYVWKKVEGWEERIEIGEKDYVPPVMAFGGMGKAVFVGSGVYMGDSGGVYVLRVDSGNVKLRLGGVDMGVRFQGDEVVVPKWVYRDGRVEVEAVGGKVSLYHFEGVAPSSGPMGIAKGGNSSGIYMMDGYILVKGEGELRVYGLSGRLVKGLYVKGEVKVNVEDLPKGVYFARFKGKVMKFIRR